MTKEEKICFQLGHRAFAADLPFAPSHDHSMDKMVSESRSERGHKRNLRNMSAWRMGYLHQYVLDGELLDTGMFRCALSTMLLNAKDSAVQPWLEFVEDITRNGQYVDFQEEPDLETAKAHWYDTFLAGFYKLKAEHGETAAAKTLELGLEGLCLYPYELEEAAVQLSQGTSVEQLGQMMREGLLERDTVKFPKLRDVLETDIPVQNLTLNLGF